MYSPIDLASNKYSWKFDCILRLPPDATSTMEGMQSICSDFASIAGLRLGLGESALLEATLNSFTYSIGGKGSISLIAFWSEIWAHASCTISTFDRTLALKLEPLIVEHLPRITLKELLADRPTASLSDIEIMMLGHMLEWGETYSPELSKMLCEAWGTRSEELKCELAFCFYGAATYWRDFYPLLKESLKADLTDLLKMSVQSAVDMMEFDMRLEGQSDD
jgi:hypothetical protein